MTNCSHILDSLEDKEKILLDTDSKGTNLCELLTMLSSESGYVSSVSQAGEKCYKYRTLTSSDLDVASIQGNEY
jgi:hypothetical protein